MSVQVPLKFITFQSAATATGNGTYMEVGGSGAVAFQSSGTFTATVTFEGTINGQNWVSLPVMDASGLRQTTATAAGVFWANTAGLTLLRARVSAYTSGSVTVVGQSLAYPLPTMVAAALGASDGTDIGSVDILSIAAGDNNIGNVDIASALPAGTNAIGKLAANSGVDIGDVDILSIAAGDNNIGNVDIASIAAGDNNIGNVDIASALPAGTNAIGKLAANSGVDIGDVDVTSIAAGTNLIGDVGAAARATGGGSSIYSGTPNAAATVKATAGQVYAIDLQNSAAAVAYLQVFNVAGGTAVTLGTTVPAYSVGVPGNGHTTFCPSVPVVQGTGIKVACTTTRAGATGTTNVAVNIVYA